MHIPGTKMDVFVCVLCSWRLSYGFVCPFLCLPLYFHTFVPLFFDSSPLFFICSRSSTFPFLLPLAPSRVNRFSFAIAYHSYFYSTILLSFCPVDSPRLSIPLLHSYTSYTSAYAATFLPPCLFYRSLQPSFALYYFPSVALPSLWTLSWIFSGLSCYEWNCTTLFLYTH